MLTAEGTTKFASANGLKIHYHEAGDGPVLIMASGSHQSGGAWIQNGANIEGLAENFRVILYNPPPVGLSDKSLVSDAPRNKLYAGILRDFMDALGIEKAHVYGGSPGATQCMRLAVESPERAGKLILQAVVGVGASYFTPPFLEGQQLSRLIARDPSYENIAKQIEVMVPRADRRTEELLKERYLAANDAEANRARGQLTGPNDSVMPDLERITHETLLIWGLDERDVPLDHALRLAVSMPNAMLHIYGGGTGHFPQFERPAEFNRLVTTFLLN